MTIISPLRVAAPVGLPRRSVEAGGDRFVMADSTVAELPRLAASRELGEMRAGLLSLQDEADTPDERGRRRARTLLAGLTALQLRLLTGEAATPATLAALRTQLHSLPEPEHPALAAALAAVVLRVEVELARRVPAPAATQPPDEAPS